MKYQFCIRFDNIDRNSAASKAVIDCSTIFSKNGYENYTIVVGDNSNKWSYYLRLFKEITKFFFNVKRQSIIGVQYPLLSVNVVFKYFIKIVKYKKATFFCIIHDLESLRNGGKDKALVDKEVYNLNFYDYIISHNDQMTDWLKKFGVFKPIIPIELFDYLTNDYKLNSSHTIDQPIVYAGNLAKSTFIYQLSEIKKQTFNLYGPGYNSANISSYNVDWRGDYSPQEVVQKLHGSFGLIWDGNNINYCDELLGNYLKYNNPHKFSLYLAAGLPVIAPGSSAIGQFIKIHNIGILIDNLHDLSNISINKEKYDVMLKNVIAIRTNVITGQYFEKAVSRVEDKIYSI